MYVESFYSQRKWTQELWQQQSLPRIMSNVELNLATYIPCTHTWVYALTAMSCFKSSDTIVWHSNSNLFRVEWTDPIVKYWLQLCLHIIFLFPQKWKMLPLSALHHCLPAHALHPFSPTSRPASYKRILSILVLAWMSWTEMNYWRPTETGLEKAI